MKTSDIIMDADAAAVEPLPASLRLTPVSRRPIVLARETASAIERRMVPSRAQLLSPPVVSVVTVTFNNLLLTRLCLDSLMTDRESPATEIIIVDNGSTDGTCAYLRDLESACTNVHVILNDVNKGFSAANNQGLALARCDYLVLLNNDTIVGPGWLNPLLREMGDDAVGLVSPVTNRIGTDAEVATTYDTYGEMIDYAESRAKMYAGSTFPADMLAMFCVAMRRNAYKQIGPLDEAFGAGLFEDDDYSMRARRLGYKLVVAEDAFVHHFGQASTGALRHGEYGELFHANRKRFEDKWNVVWQPPARRHDSAYGEATQKLKDVVSATVPPGATVIVASKGDTNLVDFADRAGWHFPQDAAGTYAGEYPEDSETAIAHLEALRLRGGQYFAVPNSSRWWLDHYAGFAAHLRGQYRLVADSADCGIIFALETKS